MSLLLLQLFLLQLSILIWRGTVSWQMEKSKMYKVVYIYSKTTGYYEKCSCSVKRCFLQTQCKCNETFIIEWIKTWKIMNILLFENSVRPILLFSAWIIIASWTYCWKYFVLFFFCHLNEVRNLHLGGYTAYIIHP